jgi:hypothetical protein
MAMRKRLGEILVRYYRVPAESVDAAVAAQASGAGRLGETLLRVGAVTEHDLVRALAFQQGLPIALNLSTANIAREVLALVPAVIAAWDRVVPVAIAKTAAGERLLVLAMADPFDQKVLRELEEMTGCAIQPAITTHEEINRALRLFYGNAQVAEPSRPADSSAHVFGDEPRHPSQVDEKETRRDGRGARIPASPEFSSTTEH